MRRILGSLLVAAALWPAAAASAQTAAPDPAQRVVRATWTHEGTHARLLRLRISGLTEGLRVTAHCRGRGCRTARRLGAARGSLMNGKRAFPGRLMLGRGARLEVRIVRLDGGVDVVRYRVGRRGRVTVTTLCALQGGEASPC
jgi:hypothetical protein